MIAHQLSYEELGREADLAARHYATAKQAVIEMGSAETMGTRLEVSIKGASWENGLLYLQGFLSEVVREQLADVVSEALRRMEAAAGAKLDLLRDAFQARGGEPAPEIRQVPRQLDAAAFAEQTAPSDPGPAAASVEGYRATLDPALPATPAAGTAAPSGPEVGSSPAPASVPPVAKPRAIQPADYAAPTLVEGSTIKLDPREAELFDSIIRKPGVALARNATLGTLLRLRLVAQDGKGYSLTPLGETFAENVRASIG